MRAKIGLVGLAAMVLFSPALSSANEMPYNLPPFHAIASKGSVDIDVTAGSAQSVKLIADAAIIERMIVVVRDGVLHISQKPGSYSYSWGSHGKGPHFAITVPSLDAVSVAGSADVHAHAIKADKFDVAVAGSGDIHAEGNCKIVSISIAGSGDVSTGDLKCTSASISVRGSGDVTAYASEAASVSVAGSGDVTVLGNPKTRQKAVAGSGDITFK